jgi:ComEC/Rec2-related protein
MLLGVYSIALCAGAVGIVLQGLHTGSIRWTGRCCVVFSCLLVLTGTAAVPRVGHVGLPVESVCRIRGTLLDDGTPISSGDTVRYTIRTESVSSETATASAGGEITLFLSGRERLGWGQLVEVEATIRPERHSGQTLSPSATALHAGSTNSVELGVAWADSDCLRSLGWLHPLFEYRHRVREGARRAIDQAGAPVSGLMTALLLGARDDIGKAEYETFRAAGCAHVLALSGMHLGILVMAAGWVCGLLLGKRAAVVCLVPVVVCFVLLVGPKASLIRAAIMFLLAAGFRLLALRPYGLHVLGLSFAIFVVCDPTVATDLSFQLSYLALFGLLSFGRSIGRIIGQFIPIRPLADAVGYSVGAWVCTAPLSIMVFGATYPVGIVSGLVITPLVTAFIWCGIASILVGRLPRYSISLILRRLRGYIDWMTGLAAEAPAIRTPSALGVFYCILVAVLLSGYILRRRRLNGKKIGLPSWIRRSTTIRASNSSGFSHLADSGCRNGSDRTSSSPNPPAN